MKDIKNLINVKNYKIHKAIVETRKKTSLRYVIGAVCNKKSFSLLDFNHSTGKVVNCKKCLKKMKIENQKKKGRI